MLVQEVFNGTITASGLLNTIKNLNRKSVTSAILYVILGAAPTGTTPTLEINVNAAPDEVNFATVGNSSVLNASGIYRTVLTNILEDTLQVSATVTGTTPSFTSVTIYLVFSDQEQ